MKHIAHLLLVTLTLCARAAQADIPPRTTFSCAVSDSVSGALDSAVQGNKKLTLLIGEGIFRLTGMSEAIMGQIAPTGEANASVTGDAGDYFAQTLSHTLTAASGEHAGRAAFTKDAQGVNVALVQLTDGQYFLGCFDSTATAADFSGTPQIAEPEQPKEPELTDEQKLEKLFAEAPKQRGKEQQIFGSVSLTKPDEGYYKCTFTRYGSDNDTKSLDQIDTDDKHVGFDLFADGSYRLKKSDGTYEKSGEAFRHNPSNGVVLFDQGTLSVYLKWPIHVRKKVDGQTGEVSILYRTSYDYGGPLDDMTVCIRAGEVQSQSPNAEIAERAQKNLNPPPPGSKRLSGLFYRQEWVPMVGPNFSSYQVDYYYYRYFQDNGYVWLNDPPDDGDFEKLGCNKPMVDKSGEPTCTTYTIEDGLFSKPVIRIGHDAPVPFANEDGSVSLDGTNYFAMPAQLNLRLNKTLSYFSYNGIGMREGHITFGNDGRYESSSASGVLFTQEIPDVSRVTVTGYNPGDELKGTYQINDYSITFKSDAGIESKRFFGFISEGMIMVGGQPYIDRSD